MAAAEGRARAFTSWDGLRIAYRVWGGTGATGTAAPPVVLHHGFVANAEANWLATGVVAALLDAGRRVIAPDARGHGSSEKPHDPARYGEQRMARDLGALLDALELDAVDLVGYSMGAVVSLIYASGQARVRRLVVGGVGSGVLECGGVDRRAVSNESLIEALTALDPSALTGREQRAFRALADALGADREALAAQARAVFRGEIPLAAIGAPTLVLAGAEDPLAVRPQTLADAIPNARLQMLSGDHMRALADPRFARSIVEFLA
ncbi:MAG TPA: alpha/beta fold hydrolase [Solirubrobacteraceae bacterium]|nr:alpha/beta fold hydrolase [Solirubrobacteraceae bacterium]